ncbi:putative protein [Zhongshania aliphaticivorans]|uniref:AB hydrolase-1 domain-containing protein n=1 Tax=Zhongshania aliphaticivorans TaxID=1470434 RepID=A0A5S9MXM8_9GAMM|nr:alpha/beta hydrolase [Zhongshania aliphaticivorans]CAA0081915.1 putative protein [Zhongshania aliphaticivorans]CAA0084582.1 putative protein [Zhongshania aliphaticivorans]
MNPSVIRRGYANLDSGQLHFREAGNPEKPTLLLLHQAPSSGEMYEKMMVELASEFHLLAPDLPGFGQSDGLGNAPIDGDTITSWADVIAGFCAEFTSSIIGVFGHHTGATVATELLYRHPQFNARLMLSGPTLLNKMLKEILPEKARAFPETKDGLHLLGMWQRMAQKDFAAPLDIVLRETSLGLAMGSRYPDAYQAVIEHDYRKAISAIRQPVLMFAGTADPLYSVLDEAFECVQQGVKTEIAAGTSWVCDLNPNAVCQLIRRFMVAEVAEGSKVEWCSES